MLILNSALTFYIYIYRFQIKRAEFDYLKIKMIIIPLLLSVNAHSPLDNNVYI